MQISQHTLDAAARLREVQDRLLSLPIQGTPTEQLEEVCAAHQKALEALAYATLDDIAGVTREASR